MYVCSCSAQGVVFSSRHGVELRPYSYSIPLYRYQNKRYFRQTKGFLFEVLTYPHTAGFESSRSRRDHPRLERPAWAVATYISKICLRITPTARVHCFPSLVQQPLMAQRAGPRPLRPTSGDPARSLGRLPAPPQGESRRARSESRFRVPDEPVHPNVPPVLGTEFANKLSDERHYHEAEALLASQPWRQKPVQTPRTGWQTAQPEELVRRLRHGSPDEQVAAAKKAEGLARREPQQRELLAGAVPAVVMMLAASTPPHASETAAALLRSLASSAALKPAILRAGAVVQLVRLVEERGSSAAQQALDRLSICDAAVKKQIEWSLSREGPTVTLTLTLALALALTLTLTLTATSTLTLTRRSWRRRGRRWRRRVGARRRSSAPSPPSPPTPRLGLGLG